MSKKENFRNFLRQFRDEQSNELKQLTASQFMEIWNHYDHDCKNQYLFLKIKQKLGLFNLIQENKFPKTPVKPLGLYVIFFS